MSALKYSSFTAVNVIYCLLAASFCLGQLVTHLPTRPSTYAADSIPSGVYPTEIMLASFRNVTPGAQQFGLDLLTQISDSLTANNARTDVMISPFAVWSLLLLLVEGAIESTLAQLRSTLHVDENQQQLRQAYSFVQRYLKTKTATIEVGSLQAIFTDINVPPKREYEDVITRYYGASLIPVDFHNPGIAYQRINDEVRNATNGLIQHALLPQDLVQARLVMLSSLYFKGQWKHPFNRSLTRLEPFFDEDGNEIAQVEMMTQEENFNYAGMNELDGHVLELPYGKENRLSMLIVLPRRGVSLNKVVHNLQRIGTKTIFERLAEAAIGYEEDVVEVFLPKFTTMTDFSLPSILHKMGISNIFDSERAGLDLISSDVYVKNILHSTKIIVDEEGTEAAAATIASLVNKATPPKFYLNRPFIYLIVEKSTNLLLFAGQVQNPKSTRSPSNAQRT